MYKKIFLIMLLFLLASCSSNNENIIPQNNITDIEVSKTSDLDLVKKYFTHLSKKDYLSAYNLKETDQTFEEFKWIYSDSRVFIQYSSEELENWNIKTINIIDDVPYGWIFKVFNWKIKTISAWEMKDYFYDKNKKIIISKNFESYSFDRFSLIDFDKYNKAEYYTFSFLDENFTENNYSQKIEWDLKNIQEQKNKKYFVDLNNPDCYFLSCPISLFWLHTDDKEYINLEKTIFAKINNNSEKLEKFSVKNISKIIHNYWNIDIFIESISESPFVIITYEYRLTKNMNISYFWVMKKEKFSIENIEIKPKNELINELEKNNNKRILNNKGKYYTFKNSIWFSDGKTERLILSDWLPWNKLETLKCLDTWNQNTMKCYHNYFENFNPEYKIFSKESENYMKM